MTAAKPRYWQQATEIVAAEMPGSEEGTSAKERWLHAKAIYDRYLYPGATFEVSCRPRKRAAVEHTLESVFGSPLPPPPGPAQPGGSFGTAEGGGEGDMESKEGAQEAAGSYAEVATIVPSDASADTPSTAISSESPPRDGLPAQSLDCRGPPPQDLFEDIVSEVFADLQSIYQRWVDWDLRTMG